MKFTQKIKSLISKKILKVLTVFVALTLAIFTVFYSPQDTSSAATNDDCASLADGITPQPGLNCLFSAMTQDGKKVLPLCRSISGTDYVINSANILTTGNRRVTCSNLSDLPLCSTFKNTDGSLTTEIEPDPRKNCVPVCDASFNGDGVRGEDYAVHNRDCVRFCKNPEEGFDASRIETGVNCTDRKCHQLDNGTIPVPDNNCSLMPCNLLTPSELANVFKKIYDDEQAGRSIGQYCNGSTDINGKPLKCYKFNLEQLDYVKTPEMCVIHNCKPSCSTYVSQTDTNGDGVINGYDHNDVLNILDRNKDGVNEPNSSYVAKYESKIYLGYSINSDSYCTPAYCRPIIKKQYRCVNGAGEISGDNTRDINRSGYCDSSGDGSICSNNLCYATIDCNLLINSSKPECRVPEEGSTGSIEDRNKSWFYLPRPLHKATEVNGSIRLITDMQANLCYTKSQMKNHRDNFDNGEEFDRNRGGRSEDGKWGLEASMFSVAGIRITLGWFHSSVLPDETRSPKACDVPNVGGRGTGYYYLCYGDGNPNGGSLYAKVADHTAYHKGGVASTFSEGDGIHKVNICLRFRNWLRPDDGTSETCGERQCAINCSFGSCDTQSCGADVCRTLKISDLNPAECELTSSNSEGSNDKGCMTYIDDNLRIRIQRYGSRKLCAFLDVKGQTAYDNGSSVSSLFLKGDEKLSDGSCVAGNKNASGNCNGYSSYSDKTLAEKWRTIKFGSAGNIPYIKNNQVDSNGDPLNDDPKLRGFYNRDGQFFPEQECIYVPLRSAPPKFYNLANLRNSIRLFTPPVYILNSLTKAGSGIISAKSYGADFGPTDFNNPAILVKFGTTTKEMSLAVGKTGYESTREVITLETTIGTNKYSIETFVRKEFNESLKKPTFCLYRKVVDTNNVELRPERIGCVERKLPEIFNSTTQQKSVIYLDPTSTFNSSRIAIKFMANFGSDNVDNNCIAGSDDACSSELKFENIDSAVPTCNSAVVDPTDPNTISPEMYNLCAKREECSQLNIECIQNEIDMQAARVAGTSINSYLTVRSRCNNYLLPLCNAKKGIVGQGATVINQNPNGENSDSTSYGWFNEICFVSGDKTDSFDSNLQKVLAYKSNQYGKGKCLTYEGETRCPNGGKAPQCNCIIANEYTTITNEQEVRVQTNREAGLCVDMPIPQTCPAIKYNPSSTISNDPDYIYTSLNQNAYGANQSQTSSVVHISHKTRSEANQNGNAEFPLSILGSINISGTCTGFWKNSISPTTGIESPPNRTCNNNNGNAVWNDVINNPCSRYSCPAINTTGAESSLVGANYQGGYASTEIGDNKGVGDGFATWAKFTKTNDFLEYANATSCIPGFKKINSQAVASGPNLRTYESKITNYINGITPQRSCNQLGNWQSPINSCRRITCPAITPPSNPANSSDWVKWYDASGATFQETNASRSTLEGTTATGVCNNSLGFYNLGSPPTRKCDYLGNWGPIINPCTTRCDAVTTLANAEGSNSGNAFWSSADVPAGQSEILGSFQGCIPTYKKSQYPPLKDKYGNPFTLSSNPNYTNSIPLDVKNDTRALTDPKRYCRALSQDGIIINNWAAVDSPCISGCPSYAEDPRINAGRTQHKTKNGLITINWPPGQFNKWYYASSSDSGPPKIDTPNFNGMTAANFFRKKVGGVISARDNQSYILGRFCNAEGKWSDPVPQCATNGGVISQDGVSSYAIYRSSSPRTGLAGSDSLTVSVGDTATSTQCQGNPYYQKGIDTGSLSPISSYKCSYYDSNQNIDEVYFDYVSGDACQVYCAPPALNAIFNSSSIYNESPTKAPSYTAIGGSIQISCVSGYGKAFDNNSSTSDNLCGITNTSRSNINPTVICQSDGTFGNLTNGCEKCQECLAANLNAKYKNLCVRLNCGSSNDVDQIFVVNDTIRDGVKCNGVGDGDDLITPIYFSTAPHNPSGSFATSTISGDKCGSAYLTYRCVDGMLDPSFVSGRTITGGEASFGDFILDRWR